VGGGPSRCEKKRPRRRERPYSGGKRGKLWNEKTCQEEEELGYTEGNQLGKQLSWRGFEKRGWGKKKMTRAGKKSAAQSENRVGKGRLVIDRGGGDY